VPKRGYPPRDKNHPTFKYEPSYVPVAKEIVTFFLTASKTISREWLAELRPHIVPRILFNASTMRLISQNESPPALELQIRSISTLEVELDAPKFSSSTRIGFEDLTKFLACFRNLAHLRFFYLGKPFRHSRRGYPGGFPRPNPFVAGLQVPIPKWTFVWYAHFLGDKIVTGKRKAQSRHAVKAEYRRLEDGDWGYTNFPTAVGEPFPREYAV
jgi:hypothetical protein